MTSPSSACVSIGPNSEAWLREAAGGDPLRYVELLARVVAGEPAAYVAGFLRFRGHRFEIDDRAYVTDPEATHLIDQVLAVGDALQIELGRPPRVLDFGIGAGTLGISVRLERPTWTMIGLDVDPRALTLARENAIRHGVELELCVSDHLADWPAAWPAPDLIFGDPPWGGEEDLYADGDTERDAAYYHRMPVASAYPRGGRCAIHDELIRQLIARDWPSTIVLNYGVLPIELIERSVAGLGQRQLVQPKPGMTVLIGRVR
jgi:hypothetical protein